MGVRGQLPLEAFELIFNPTIKISIKPLPNNFIRGHGGPKSLVEGPGPQAPMVATALLVSKVRVDTYNFGTYALGHTPRSELPIVELVELVARPIGLLLVYYLYSYLYPSFGNYLLYSNSNYTLLKSSIDIKPNNKLT